MFFTHNNLRLICLVKKRLIILRKFDFLSLIINLSIRKKYILTREIENKKCSFSSNEVFHHGTKVLNNILKKCKSHGDKRGLGYISKTKTPTSGAIVFAKGKGSICILPRQQVLHTESGRILLNLESLQRLITVCTILNYG